MCAQGPGLGSWHTPSDSQLLWSTLLLPNDCLLPTAWLPYCHGISVGFYNWNAPFHAEMWLVSLWKEEKTNWQVWQSLVLSLAETVGSWQQKELSAQILNLSESRCMFKRENKGPSGMKLRAQLHWSWVRRQWEGNILFCCSPLCVLTFCAAPTPYFSNIMPPPAEKMSSLRGHIWMLSQIFLWPYDCAFFLLS